MVPRRAGAVASRHDDELHGGFVPAGAFAVAAIASTAGVRWALIGPGLAIAICAAALLARGATSRHGTTLARRARLTRLPR